MDNNLYNMIFKRKSFHTFKNVGDEYFTDAEIEDIEKKFYEFEPLVKDIKVRIKIVNEAPFTKRGQGYSIHIYSEKKDNYLQNIGYIGEQLDLYLVSKNIGTLWFGMGKTDEKKLDGLDFVIMIAIAKVDSADKFRKDFSKSKRKEVSEIWTGDAHRDIAEIVRFAPSAVNSQPWRVNAEENRIDVYRYNRGAKGGLFPLVLGSSFNQLDMGIFLCFIELCLANKGIEFERQLFVEDSKKQELKLNARYIIK